MLAAALRYASRGVHVFPVRGKVPVGGRGVLDATADLDRVRAGWREHPDAGVAIAAGASQLVILDLDLKNGEDGNLALGYLESRLGALPPTTEARTPSGGRHLYFRVRCDGLKPTAGRYGEHRTPGLDVRAGNSYVVAPPSPGYRWTDTRKPAELPEGWLEALREPERSCANTTGSKVTGRHSDTRTNDRARKYALRALELEGRDLAETPAGQRNQALVRAAGVLGQLQPAISAAEITDVLIAACDRNGSLRDDGRRKCIQTIRRGLSWGASNPRVLPSEAA